MKDRKTEKRWRKNERNHGCTVAYADDFVTERKSIASLDRFDCIQFKMKFDFFTPSSFLPTLVRFPPTSWCAYCIFLCLHYWEHAAWIRVYYSSSVPKSSLVSISDYSSMCVETGWAGCVLSNTKQFGLYPLCPPEYRQGHNYSTETLTLLKVQNDMFLNLLCTQSHRARVPRLIR